MASLHRPSRARLRQSKAGATKGMKKLTVGDNPIAVSGRTSIYANELAADQKRIGFAYGGVYPGTAAWVAEGGIDGGAASGARDGPAAAALTRVRVLLWVAGARE